MNGMIRNEVSSKYTDLKNLVLNLKKNVIFHFKMIKKLLYRGN